MNSEEKIVFFIDGKGQQENRKIKVAVTKKASRQTNTKQKGPSHFKVTSLKLWGQ